MITVTAVVPKTSLTVDIQQATAVAANPTPVPLVNVSMISATIGVPGATGPRGVQGLQGPPGPEGPPGEGGTGSGIESGVASPDASTGSDGTFYLEVDEHVLHGPKHVPIVDESAYTNQVWVNPASALSAGGAIGHDFTFATSGRITALKHYRAGGNPGRTLRLWHADHTQIENVTSTGESGTGWRTLPLPTPVPVVAGQVVKMSMDTGSTVIPTAPDDQDWVNGDVTKLGHGYFNSLGSRPTDDAGYGVWIDLVFQADLWPTALDPAGVVAAHEAKTDPHPQYLTQVEGSGLYVPKSIGDVAVILSGTDSPAADVGVAGNFYLDVDDHVLYGPKAGILAQSAITTQVPNVTVEGIAPIALGHDFRFGIAGAIIGFRWLRDPTEPAGTRLFKVWTDPTTAISTLITQSESTPGWKTVTLPTPVPVTAGQTLRVVSGTSADPLGRLAPRPDGDIVNGDVTLVKPVSGTYYSQEGIDVYPISQSGSLYFHDVIFQGSSYSGDPWPVALRG